MILRVIGPLIILLMVAGTALPAASASSEVGTIRDLTPLDPEHIPLSNPVNVVTGGPPFLMSDNPEWVTQPGIHSLATLREGHVSSGSSPTTLIPSVLCFSPLSAGIRALNRPMSRLRSLAGCRETIPRS